MREDAVVERGQNAMLACLDRVPFLKVREILVAPALLDSGADLLVRVETSTGQSTLVVEAKSSGQPRIARQVIMHLKAVCGTISNAYPVFLAPYVTASTGRICEEEGIGWIDLAGNCRLTFGQIYIERGGEENPFSEARELRSLYSPKAERIMRVLLMRPRESWKVESLSKEAVVSIGLVSKVKHILEDREWLAMQQTGIRLRDPEAVLAEWAREYRYARHRVTDYYSLASGVELEERFAEAAREIGGRVALTGFSAAMRYAPSVRAQRSMIFLQGDLTTVATALQLRAVPSGANLTVIQPYDEGVFYGEEQQGGIPLVCPVQAYLDVTQQPDRGEEAGEAVLREVIRNLW